MSKPRAIQYQMKQPKLYTESQVVAARSEIMAYASKHLEAVIAADDLAMVIMMIDLTALFAPVKDKIEHLAGMDETLSAKFTAAVRTAGHIGRPVPENLNREISARIAGIMNLPKDGGDSLLQAIQAARPGSVGQYAEMMRETPRQGEWLDPEKVTLYEWAEEAKRGGLTGWKAIALAMLDKQPENDHERELLAQMEKKKKESGLIALTEYVKSAYHQFKKSKSGQRYLATKP